LRGWRGCDPLHFALQESGDREAGGGARAPKAAAQAASLAAPPTQAVAALPCPSPRHRPVVRASSANGAAGFGDRPGRARRVRPRDSRTTIQGCPRARRAAGFPVKAEARFKSSVGARRRPLLRSKASFVGQICRDRAARTFMGLLNPGFRPAATKVAETEQTRISADRTGRQERSLCGYALFFPCRCIEPTMAIAWQNSSVGKLSRRAVARSQIDGIRRGRPQQGNPLDTLMERGVRPKGPRAGSGAGALGNEVRTEGLLDFVTAAAVDNAGDENPGGSPQVSRFCGVPHRCCCNACLEHIENIVYLLALPNAPMFFTFSR
jgi:hypothetical protein